jgi:phosphoribosylanthranilate isomerase
MKIQIFTMQTPKEAQTMVELGVDHIGITLANRGLPGEVGFDTARAICASGQTHDWTISRRIVEESAIPVILAGGLSPDNVAEAIRAVRPWGVDSLTHTNQPLPGGGFRKDRERVRRFVAAARGALDDE